MSSARCFVIRIAGAKPALRLQTCTLNILLHIHDDTIRGGNAAFAKPALSFWNRSTLGRRAFSVGPETESFLEHE